MAKILIISSSNLSKDPRVLRQIKALKGSHEIITCGLSSSEIDGIEEFSLLFRPSKLQPLFVRGLNLLRLITHSYNRLTWDNNVFENLSKMQYDLIIVNDPREMSLAVKLKKNQAVAPKIYFDLHEYFINVDDNKILNRMFRSLTDKYQGDADVLSTVSKEIAGLYKNRYFREIKIITNAGKYYELEPQKVGSNIKMVHHGILNRARKIEEMIDLLQFVDDRFSLDLYLLGTDKGYLEELKKRASFSNRIVFKEPVAFNQIIPMLSEYDIGLFILSDEVESYKYALPNKLFEFIQARLAIAISPNISMKSLVEKYSNGIVSNNFKAKSLSVKLNNLSRADIFRMKSNSNTAATELNDKVSTKMLLDIVEELTIKTL
ncbi:MAG: hypothetical protein ACJA1A_002910 [Saprospiraceae bacterium]|jgi:hypothetical protein|tara:strand:- start:1421 stop:2548 length:1128 start_codon:yes stop_codon:yes gene_type:complete